MCVFKVVRKFDVGCDTFVPVLKSSATKFVRKKIYVFRYGNIIVEQIVCRDHLNELGFNMRKVI